jgi:hypothetical protein
MNSLSIKLGDVYDYNHPSGPLRVIAFDSEIVMYDIWLIHKNSWRMSSLGGVFAFYRLERNYFEANTRYLRHEPLSELEANVFRPDLPFAFARNQHLSWYENLPSNQRIDNGQVLSAPAIYIRPFGPREGLKPDVLVRAGNGEFFTENELISLAKDIQNPHLGSERLTDGVGVYRSGIKKRIPLYYLWGALSKFESQL